jgi:hypothetical protein
MSRYFLCAVMFVLVACSTPTAQPTPNQPTPNQPTPNQPTPNQPTPNQPTPPNPNQPSEPTFTQAASLLLAQQNNELQNSPLALSPQSSKDKINASTFYDGITVYLYMSDYSMSNKLMATDTFTVESFKYGPKRTANDSQGLSLLNGLTKDIYFWVSGNVPGGLDDDAVWARVTNNFRALAQAANELNEQGDYSFKGIFFDDESSKVGGFFPFDCEVYGAITATDTCALRQSKMAERGQQIMTAMLSVWPDLTWVQLHTPAVSVLGYDDTPLPSDPARTYGGDADFDYEDYELAGPFFAGMAEAVHEAKTGSIISGGNIYKLRDQRDFAAHESYVDTMGNDPLLTWLPTSLKGDVWKTTVKAGFGVYNKDFPPLPPVPYKDLAVATEKLTNARCTADELVFLYIEPDEGSNADNWYIDMPEAWRNLLESSVTC